MSKSANSPTARLLQSSRLFSLPRALPRQSQDRLAHAGLFRGSDTATHPYPTLQAITTPPSSLFRGDWGLKRGIPSRASRSTNTPHIRINANDTRYQITDYESAADHTQTRSKWEEMGVPLLRYEEKPGRIGEPAPVSAYEDAADTTDRAREDRDGKRWKSDGPWLVGMAEGEFEAYLTRTLKGRKQDWRDFLRVALLDDKVRQARISAQNQGQVFDEASEEAYRRKHALSEKDLDAEQKKLRDSHAADGNSSRLTALLAKFLDLAGIDTRAAPRERALSMVTRNILSEDDAPYSTHPAAGLSYLRTSAIMDNHPLHGPQEHRSPVLSRVMRFKNGVGGKLPAAKLGVGGVIMVDPVRIGMHRTAGGSETDQKAARAVDGFDQQSETGAKVWVRVDSATITDRGTIKGKLQRASDEAVAVRTGDVQRIHQQRAASFVSVNSSPSSNFPAFRRFTPDRPPEEGAGQTEKPGPSTASSEIQDLLSSGRGPSVR